MCRLLMLGLMNSTIVYTIEREFEICFIIFMRCHYLSQIKIVAANSLWSWY
jgi:hypothetical protein